MLCSFSSEPVSRFRPWHHFNNGNDRTGSGGAQSGGYLNWEGEIPEAGMCPETRPSHPARAIYEREGAGSGCPLTWMAVDSGVIRCYKFVVQIRPAFLRPFHIFSSKSEETRTAQSPEKVDGRL